MRKRPARRTAAQTRAARQLHPSFHELKGRGKLFITYYAEAGGSYGGQIEARSYREALMFAAQRRLNETVEPIPQKYKAGQTKGIANLLLKAGRTRGDLMDALHEAMFLCWLGIESGRITPREALGDGGLVHDLMHLTAYGATGSDQADGLVRLARMAREFEGRVPGWPSPPRLKSP